MELAEHMRWKLTRGKWRSSLNESSWKSASQKAFKSLPDFAKSSFLANCFERRGCLATASAVLAAYAPVVAPFMSDEAMEAYLGNCKYYLLKSTYCLLINYRQILRFGAEVNRVCDFPLNLGHSPKS